MKLNKPLIMLLLSTSALNPRSIAQTNPKDNASPTPISLQQVLTACDKALTAKENEAAVCEQGKQLRDIEITRLGKEAADAKVSESSIWKSPALWTAVGVIVGVIVGANAVKVSK